MYEIKERKNDHVKMNFNFFVTLLFEFYFGLCSDIFA